VTNFGKVHPDFGKRLKAKLDHYNKENQKKKPVLAHL
jgi:hypothetical protein